MGVNRKEKLHTTNHRTKQNQNNSQHREQKRKKRPQQERQRYTICRSHCEVQHLNSLKDQKNNNKWPPWSGSPGPTALFTENEWVKYPNNKTSWISQTHKITADKGIGVGGREGVQKLWNIFFCDFVYQKVSEWVSEWGKGAVGRQNKTHISSYQTLWRMSEYFMILYINKWILCGAVGFS